MLDEPYINDYDHYFHEYLERFILDMEDEILSCFDVLGKSARQYAELTAKLYLEEDWGIIEYCKSIGLEEIHMHVILCNKKEIIEYVDELLREKRMEY